MELQEPGSSTGLLHSACEAHDKMMHYLARGVTILVAGLAPELVIIVGDHTALWPRIRPILESQLIGKSFTSRMPRAVAAMDGDAARLRGAAALVLHKTLFRQSQFEEQDRSLRTLRPQ